MKKEHKKTSGLKKKKLVNILILSMSNWQMKLFALVEFPLWLHLCFQFSLLWFGVQHGWTCVVYGCTNRQEKGGNISFFHFPHKNPPVLKQWANAVNRLHWFPKDHSLICSVHFKESCFIVRPGKRGRLLKDGAVLTEFPTHPSYLQHQTRKRKSPKKRDILIESFHLSTRSPILDNFNW